MRVIAGTAKGMKLERPDSILTRPTTDRIKGAMFNIIQFDIEGRRVLDLFSGSGQLGIEALSRGAKSAAFVDSRADSIEVINKNLRHTKLAEHAQVVSRDVLEFVASSAANSYELILMDPPYSTDLLKNTVRSIILFDILSNGGIIICESALQDSVGTISEPYKIRKEYKYGDKKLTVIIKECQ